MDIGIYVFFYEQSLLTGKLRILMWMREIQNATRSDDTLYATYSSGR